MQMQPADRGVTLLLTAPGYPSLCNSTMVTLDVAIEIRGVADIDPREQASAGRLGLPK
jgi:hypothetical protein